MDGQRSIYLQQLRHLPRDRYDMAVLNMAPADEEDDASSEVFLGMLKDMEIPFVRGPHLQLSMEEAEVRGVESGSSSVSSSAPCSSNV